MSWQFPLVLADNSVEELQVWQGHFLRLAPDNPPMLIMPEQTLEESQALAVDPMLVVRCRAKRLAKECGQCVLVTVFAFGFDEKGNYPGALYEHTYQHLGLEGFFRLAELTQARRMTAIQTIGFVSEDGAQLCVVEAKQHGTMTTEALGENGSGYEKIFIPDGSDITVAQMSASQKNTYDVLGLAIEKLLRGNWQTFPI